MDLRCCLFVLTVSLYLGSVLTAQPPESDCKNQTQPILLSEGGTTTTTTTSKSNNCSNNISNTDIIDISGTQDTPLEKKFNKSDAALVPDISGSNIGSDSLSLDGAIGDLSGSTLGEQIGDSDEVENYPEAWTPLPGPAEETKRPAVQDPVIGEGNLLCPENWVCSTKGDNRTMKTPSGIVMKAIPFIVLGSLAFMVMMAVTTTLWMSKDKDAPMQVFGMKPMSRRCKHRFDRPDGCSTLDGGGNTNSVAVNMLAVDNNIAEGQTMLQIPLESSKRLSQYHEYCLPDVVTNEGIDENRNSRRFALGESLYMELEDLMRGDENGNLSEDQGSTSLLIENQGVSNNHGAVDGRLRNSLHIYYQPVTRVPDIQPDLQYDLPNIAQLPADHHIMTLANLGAIPVLTDLPQPSDYYPVHVPGFPLPAEELPELDIYSDLPPHCSVYEVNDTTNTRRSLMPPMDGMSTSTSSIAGCSVYTLHGPILDGDMIRDMDAEALYEQIEDRDRLSWLTSSSSDSDNSNASVSTASTMSPLLSLVPSRQSLGIEPVMFANVGAQQREDYDKIDRTKRAYNLKPKDFHVTEDSSEDYNTLVMSQWH